MAPNGRALSLRRGKESSLHLRKQKKRYKAVVIFFNDEPINRTIIRELCVCGVFVVLVCPCSCVFCRRLIWTRHRREGGGLFMLWSRLRILYCYWPSSSVRCSSFAAIRPLSCVVLLLSIAQQNAIGLALKCTVYSSTDNVLCFSDAR